MKKIILITLLAFSFNGFSQHHERAFKKIDEHARNAPFFSNPEMLVEYLVKPCKTDWQKTRAIFVWITDNIAYDTYSYRNGTVTHEKCKAMNVYRAKKGVCSGYANLFSMLCGFAEIYCEVVTGYAKGAGYYQGKTFADTNHAWNICEIDGEYHLFDVTWAAGHVNYGRFVKKFDEFWWDTPPMKYVTSHYAVPSSLNILDAHVSKSQFENMAKIDGYNNSKKHSRTPKPTTFCLTAGLAGVYSNIDNLTNNDGHYQALLYLGVLKGRKGFGQNFYGMFSSLGLGDKNPLTIEGGTIIHRFFRLSAGFRYDPVSEENTQTYNFVPSVTTGFRINISNVFIDLNLNAYGNLQHPETRVIAAIGLWF
jgi:hypothetical protein